MILVPFQIGRFIKNYNIVLEECHPINGGWIPFHNPALLPEGTGNDRHANRDGVDLAHSLSNNPNL
jgi:hypothetical protein